MRVTRASPTPSALAAGEAPRSQEPLQGVPVPGSILWGSAPGPQRDRSPLLSWHFWTQSLSPGIFSPSNAWGGRGGTQGCGAAEGEAGTAARAHLQHVLELVDAESQLGHAGLEELAQAVLLHQPHEHTEGLLLGHLGGQGTVGGGGGRAAGRSSHGPVCALCPFPFCLCSLNGPGPGCLDPHSKPLANTVSPVSLVGNLLRLKSPAEGRLAGNWSWASNPGLAASRALAEAPSGPPPAVSVLRVLSLLGSLGETPSPIDSTLADQSPCLSAPSNPGR